LVLDAVVARADGSALLRHPVAIHRRAIAILRANLIEAARIAFHAAAIDVGFVLVLDAVAARCRRNAFRRIRIAHVARAIAVHRAGFAIVAPGASAAAAIDVRFRAIELPVIARRSGFARLARRITRIARAIAVGSTRFADIAFVAFRAAAIDVRFILILHAVAARRHTGIRARDGSDSIIANLAVCCAIEQRDPLTASIHVRCAALNVCPAALRRTNRRTPMITRVASGAPSASDAFAPRTTRAPSASGSTLIR